MANMTKVYLLNVPLESDYKHTLYFASASAQTNYFLSKKIHSFEDFSYQRKDQYIRVPKKYDDVLNCNYVMYQNTDHNNKWFYAFITDLKYIDEGRTDIYIKTDCIQTWYFDYNVKPSFVEREHVLDDTIGLHTVPEQLETGDYIVNKSIKNKSLGYKGYIVGASIDLSDADANATEAITDTKPQYPKVAGAQYNGVYSGIRYFYFSSSSILNTILYSVALKGQSDAISCIFVAPSVFYETTTEGGSSLVGKVVPTDKAKTFGWSGTVGIDQEQILKPSNINGYAPKNKKLFVYPYSYLLMDNNAGGSAVYKYELFKNTNNNKLCDFNINFALTPGCSVRAVPLYYNGIDKNNIEGLNLAKYPICSWTSDVYLNWLTQNGVNIPLQIASSAVSIAGGVALAATGAGALAGASAIAGGVLGIASTVGEIYTHSLQPPQAEGNLNSGDVTYSQGDLTFTAYQMSIKAEYAKIIDDFFTMFGYKTNRVKIPNKNHRANFWFTKTIDANIDGAIPNEDMQVIKDCYNNGITFWKNSANIGNYDVDNSII